MGEPVPAQRIALLRAPVAQLDRAGGFYPPGCGFDSCRGRRTRQGANLRVRAAWHAGPRYNAVATFDADLVDERLEERRGPAGRHWAACARCGGASRRSPRRRVRWPTPAARRRPAPHAAGADRAPSWRGLRGAWRTGPLRACRTRTPRDSARSCLRPWSSRRRRRPALGRDCLARRVRGAGRQRRPCRRGRCARRCGRARRRWPRPALLPAGARRRSTSCRSAGR